MFLDQRPYGFYHLSIGESLRPYCIDDPIGFDSGLLHRDGGQIVNIDWLDFIKAISEYSEKRKCLDPVLEWIVAIQRVGQCNHSVALIQQAAGNVFAGVTESSC